MITVQYSDRDGHGVVHANVVWINTIECHPDGTLQTPVFLIDYFGTIYFGMNRVTFMIE